MKAIRHATGITAIVIAAGMLTACTGDPAADGPSAEQVQAGREVYTRIHTLIDGTPRDRLRGEAVANYRMWNATADCMRERGWDYHVMPYVVGGRITKGGAPDDLTAWAELSDDFGIAEMAALAASEGFIADGEVHPMGMEDLSAADEAAWIADMNDACMNPWGDEIVPDDSHPLLPEELRSGFSMILTQIASTPAALALTDAWADCLADRGFDVHTKHPGYDGTQLWPGFRYASEGREIEAAHADSTCRRPLHEHVLADGADDLIAFETSHQDQLAAAAKAWRDLRAEADRILAANR